MNIGISDKRRLRTVALFTWIWLIGSLISSAYFAFWMFPKIYDERRTASVQVYFQAIDSSDNSIVYYPNLEIYRKEFHKNLSDHNFLYFSACEILPLSQRPICDRTANWKAISPNLLNCLDVSNCSTSNYVATEKQKEGYLDDLVPVGEAKFSIPDLPPLSWADPTGWGDAAKLPLFFICLFLALKLGRALGEFIFLPYSK